jgi:hypothetical protein
VESPEHHGDGHTRCCHEQASWPDLYAGGHERAWQAERVHTIGTRIDAARARTLRTGPARPSFGVFPAMTKDR